MYAILRTLTYTKLSSFLWLEGQRELAVLAEIRSWEHTAEVGNLYGRCWAEVLNLRNQRRGEDSVTAKYAPDAVSENVLASSLFRSSNHPSRPPIG